MKKIDSFISVVSIIDNTVSLESYIQNLHEHLDANFEDFEILLIDQGADDAQMLQLDKLLTKITSVRYLKLASRVHNDVALAAGLENAIGDFVVLHSEIDDPIDCINDLVDLALQGFDIVIGKSVQGQSFGYSIVRPLMQWLLNRIGYNLPRNATSLRCLSRRAVNAVTQTGRFHHQFYVRINNTGFPYTVYKYTQNKNRNKKTLMNALSDGFHLMVFNSTKPLRWISGLGVFGSLMAFSFSLYSLLIHYFKDTVIEGWTTMVLFTSLLFMIMFIILAFLGEYLSRLLDDRNEQSDYIVSFEKNSSVMLNENRENVTNI